MAPTLESVFIAVMLSRVRCMLLMLLTSVACSTSWAVSLPVAGTPAPCTGALDAATAVANVLRANRQAMDGFPTSGDLTLAYAYAGQGLTGTQINRLDLRSGRFIESYQAGLAAEAFGFDGETPWRRDFSAAYTVQRGGDFPALARNAAYRNANLWWRDDRAGAKISYLGREAVDNGCADHLEVNPPGGKAFDAWFDSRTHMLSQIGEVRKFLRHQSSYFNYRRQGR